MDSDPGPAAPEASPFLVAFSEAQRTFGPAFTGDSEASVVREETRGTEIPFSRDGGDEGAKPAFPVTTFAPVVRGTFTAPAPGPAPGATDARRDAKPAAREPDEINIHIGRIEVTAVQPPAASAAGPKPRRSGSSLDDYLRQRDRRSP